MKWIISLTMTAAEPLRRLHAALVLLCLVMAAQPAWAASSRGSLLAEMEASLRDNGAKATVAKYLDCNDDNPAWLALEVGDRRAIDLTIALGPGMDGCVSESMGTVLPRAMVNHPEVLLSYYSQHPDMVRQGCVQEFWEGTTKAQAMASLVRSERALRRVHDKALLVQRDICLRDIVSARAQVRNSHFFQ